MGIVTRPSPIGTNQSNWSPGIVPGSSIANLTTNSSAPAASAYSHIVPTAATPESSGLGAESQEPTLPVSPSLANGVFVIQVPELSNRLNLKFFLADANNETGNAYIFGLKRLGAGRLTEWVGDYLGDLAIAAGSKAIDLSSRLIPSVTADGDRVYWADTITPTDDSFNDSWEVFSDTAEGAAVASVDSFGYEWIVVVLKTNSCESLGFIWNTI